MSRFTVVSVSSHSNSAGRDRHLAIRYKRPRCDIFIDDGALGEEM